MRYLCLFVFILIACFSLFSLEKDEIMIEGFWLSQNQEAAIQIFRIDDLFFGKIVWLLEPLDETGQPKLDLENPQREQQSQPILGLEILKDFRQKGYKWKGGTIYDPESGKTYSCTMKLSGDQLEIRGFIGISLLGRTEVWSRISPESDLKAETSTSPMTE